MKTSWLIGIVAVIALYILIPLATDASFPGVRHYVSAPGFVTAEAYQEFERTKPTCAGIDIALNEEAAAADAPAKNLCIGLLSRATAGETPDAKQPAGRLSVKIGSSIRAEGITIEPLEVLEDSRCPVDVQCIQAGTVRLRAKVGAGEQVFTLGKSATVEGTSVTLAAVDPAPVSTEPASGRDYTFHFEIKAQ